MNEMNNRCLHGILGLFRIIITASEKAERVLWCSCAHPDARSRKSFLKFLKIKLVLVHCAEKLKLIIIEEFWTYYYIF